MPGPTSKQILLAIGVVVLGVAGYFLVRDRNTAVPEQDAAVSSVAAPGKSEGSGTSQSQMADLVRAAELDPEKQKSIWELEHAVFELETFVGKPFAEALTKRHLDPLQRFFREDFAGNTLGDTKPHSRSHGLVSEIRREVGSPGAPIVDAGSFVKSVATSIATMQTVRKSRFRILHIERDPNLPDRWLTRWLLKVQGETLNQALAEVRSEHSLELRFANDEDIRQQPIIARWNIESEVHRLSPLRLMREVTDSSGLADVPLPDNWKLPSEERTQYHFQLAVHDYNRDGYLDIAVATADGRPLLLQGRRGPHFKDVASSVGLRRWQNNVAVQLSFLTAWIDFDDDGYPDLLMGNRLYRNESGRRFVDVTAASGLEIGYAPMGCSVADYDLDGRLDLYILYQRPREEKKDVIKPWVGEKASGERNALWRNEGDGRFRDVTAQSGTGGGTRKTFASAWLHADADAYPDLYIANDFGENLLLRNRGDGSFENITPETGTGDFATSMGVAAGDLDNDGAPDVYVANMYSKMGRRIIAHVSATDYPPGVYEQILGSCAGNRLYRGTGSTEPYDEAGHKLQVDEVGWAYAPAMADFDGDGRLDLYAATGFMSFSRHKPDG